MVNLLAAPLPATQRFRATEDSASAAEIQSFPAIGRQCHARRTCGLRSVPQITWGIAAGKPGKLV